MYEAVVIAAWAAASVFVVWVGVAGWVLRALDRRSMSAAEEQLAREERELAETMQLIQQSESLPPPM